MTVFYHRAAMTSNRRVTSMAAEPLSHADFIEEVTSRLDGELSKAQVRSCVKAVSEELADCLANGYKVNVSGIGIFEPRAKKGRKKGTLIRNPFDPDAKPKKVAKDEPDKVTIKVRAGAGLKNALPDPKKADGVALAKKLLKKKR